MEGEVRPDEEKSVQIGPPRDLPGRPNPPHAASNSAHCSLFGIFGYHLGRFREALGNVGSIVWPS